MRRRASVRGGARANLARVGALVTVGLAAACATPTLELTAAPATAPSDLAAAPGATEEPTPDGTVTLAYPGEPAGFLDLAGDDPAAADLQALWGLPLFRVDPHGQLVPALVERWELVPDADPWTVAVTVRPGSWSDGSPVRATDVVATLEALRAGPRAGELAPLVAATAAGDHEVRLSFDRPYARWPFLLDGVGVLPAATLAEAGLAGYAGALPVTGGRYRLAAYEPGLELRFEADPDGPLGAPGVAVVRVLVVPGFETALGLLDTGEVDGALGYLALNPVERAARVSPALAEAPLGGTWVALTWRPEGRYGGEDRAGDRRAAGAAIDVGMLVDGLLGVFGEVATSPVPGVEGPPPPPSAGGTVGDVTVVVPVWPEAIAFTARAVQRDLRVRDGGAELVNEPVPRAVTRARESGDAAIRELRTGPHPSLVPWVREDATALAADATVPGTPAFSDGLEAVAADALVRPLYRIGVAHVFSDRVVGVRPSAWPGLAFWDVGSWRRGAGGTG